MSLLIKALDSAEKTKQAEKNKKQAAESTSTPAPLELEPLAAPVVEQPAIPVPESEMLQSKLSQVPAKDSELTLSEPQKSANTLTLEEEAGLSTPSLAINKYAKTKPTVAKAATSSATSKGNFGETQNIAKPELATPTPVPATSTFQARPTTVDANQKTAAKAFVANQAVKSPSSKYALFALAVAGALIIWLGLQGYTYIKPLFTPPEVAVKPATSLQSESIAIEPVVTEPVAIPAMQVLPTDEQGIAKELSNSTNGERPGVEVGKAVNSINAFTENLNANLDAPVPTQGNNAQVAGRSVPPSKPTSTVTSTVTNRAVVENEGITSRESLKITSKTPSPAVDPTLLSAYQAFTRGDDSIAQQQYRLVLQKDVRNIDALLGMAAIAQRQGRQADATGWFQKVLEIEPRNSIALSSIINSQTFNDTIASESRLKSMLASQPGAAHLHAALGNLYAEQNQWTLAQEAYFNASRFAPNNADYVFNLAISLDQLGKTNLALKQYQRALELLSQTGASSPDRGQLEARIQALQ
jgi:Tfp pilus assembly protein PilF